MTLDLTFTSLSAFATVLVLLMVYSIMDIRDRRVPNHFMLVGGIVGLGIVVISGHLLQNLVLHVAGPIFVLTVSYVLFRIGAIGGADLKAVLTLSIISPGLELAIWNDPLLEAIIGGGLELTIMLILGYTYSVNKRRKDSSQKSTRGTPLIPFLCIAYILIQMLALL